MKNKNIISHTDVEEVILQLKNFSTPKHKSQLSRFGIEDKNALGVKIPDIRKLAKIIGKNTLMAFELWKTDIHEAHLLASMIADPKELTEIDVDNIVSRFDSWDVCDCSCDLLSEMPFAENKIYEYAENQSVFVKRTAFVFMCYFAVHHKQKTDDFFYPFLDLIEKHAWDERNFVRQAVNWALRQIGKRNEHLRLKAIETVGRILNQNTKSARWIATDALRELNNEKIIQRLKAKN